MKILHVVHAYWPAIGGSEFLMQQVSEYLANKAEEDVTVYTTFAYNTSLFTTPHAPSLPEDKKEETLNGVKIRRFPVRNRWGKVLYVLQYILYRLRVWGNGRVRMLFYGPISPQMKKAIKKSSADIIAAAPFPLNHTNYVFKNQGKKPVVLIGCIHTTDKHGFTNPRIIKNIKRADGYIALTQHEKEYLTHQWGIDEKKICVIGVGIEVDTEPTPPGQQILRKLLEIAESDPIIAFVGQHGLHKGIETLLLAMPLVWHRFPEARLIIAGGMSPFTDAIKELSLFIDNQTNINTNKSKEEKRIFFLDNIDEQLKSEILSECDIFTTPSGFESFGITILEAWKRKKPVIACRIPATMNLIEEYETGMLVDYKNSRELAEALVELIADPHLRKIMGEKGYQKLIKEYSREVVGKQYYEFYQEVVNGAR
jgi:glycosyltransferase involved in cell wall biosynthesis